MKASHFTKKYGVQFVSERGRISEPFHFDQHDPHESSQTWQVRRSEFDQLLLDNARKHGVAVHEETRVLEVLFDGTRAVGVRVRGKDGAEREVMLAARELNVDKLPVSSRNWINEKLIYTHGYGVTMNTVNGFTPRDCRPFC